MLLYTFSLLDPEDQHREFSFLVDVSKHDYVGELHLAIYIANG